jgi:molybdate transport system regulatory protein
LESIRNISEAICNGNLQAVLASLPLHRDAAGMAHAPVTLRLRLLFGDRLVFGPGKGELLARIADTGSIAAAGRAMGMSYKRAWALVEEMNAAFRVPLVRSVRGGAGGGGAALSEAGREVLAAYRAMLGAVDAAAAPEIDRIVGLLSDMSDGK